MSHRIETKQVRRVERQQLAERVQHRQRLLRRGGYWAVGILAAAIVGFAALGGSSGKTPAAQTMAGHGEAASGTGPTPGEIAPAFALTDVVSGRQVTAGSLRGHKTLMFFSEGVNCQACMVQAADLQKDGVLKKAGIQLVSVTTDPPADLAQAGKQYGIRTPMLADPSTKMTSAYGMLGHGGMGHATQAGHAFMLIDKNGRVTWHQAYQEMYVPTDQLLNDMMAVK